jgi:hypothetical protein
MPEASSNHRCRFSFKTAVRTVTRGGDSVERRYRKILSAHVARFDAWTEG